MVEFKECPFCENDDVSLKTLTIIIHNGEDFKETYTNQLVVYCDGCGANATLERWPLKKGKHKKEVMPDAV